MYKKVYSQFSLKLTNGTGATATGTHINRLVTKLEGYDTNHLEIGTANAKKVTLSFHVKSSITGTYIVSFLDSGNDNGYPASYTINSANTWEKKTITLTMSDYGSWVGSTTNSANLTIHWDLGSGPDRDLSNLNAWNDGTANDFSHSSQTEWVGTTGSTFYLTGVQFEVGEQATPFEHRSYGEEEKLCRRFYQRTGGIAYYPWSIIAGQSSTLSRSIQPLITPMRATPSFSTEGTHLVEGTSSQTVSSTSIDIATQTTVMINVNSSSGHGEDGSVGRWLAHNTTGAYIIFDAEL